MTITDHRAMQRLADHRAIQEADFSGLDPKSRSYVAAGALGLVGVMGDRFHRVEHRDDIPWNRAPRPFPIHRCRVWTSEWFGLSQVCRCACGASIENIRQKWHGRNSRRWAVNAGARLAIALKAVAFIAGFLLVTTAAWWLGQFVDEWAAYLIGAVFGWGYVAAWMVFATGDRR